MAKRTRAHWIETGFSKKAWLGSPLGEDLEVTLRNLGYAEPNSYEHVYEL